MRLYSIQCNVFWDLSKQKAICELQPLPTISFALLVSELSPDAVLYIENEKKTMTVYSS